MKALRGSSVGKFIGYILLLGAALAADVASGQEAQWIWSPEQTRERIPQSECFFRKRFSVAEPVSGEIAIAADDEYELYVNGRRLGTGEGTRKLDRYDLTPTLARGRNLVAVKVANTQGATAGLAVRVVVKDRQHGTQSFSTDSSWLTSLKPLPLWYSPLYNDSRWAAAKSYGRLGQTPPWDRQTGAVAAGPRPSPAPRSLNGQAPVEVPARDPNAAPEAAAPAGTPVAGRQAGEANGEAFEVERVLDGAATGSLLAMTFNEFGHIVAARENGPLLLIYDSDQDGVLDKARVYCDQVRHCQGILCLNGDVFVTGDGPDGAGLYRLSDKNRDGTLEEVTTLLKFRGATAESGPHAIALGKDGFLYLAVSGQAQADAKVDDGSPHRGYYEGGMLTPSVDEPQPDAGGGSAPGGTIVRVSLNGEKVQLVAGGFRNAYDLCFRQGELFVTDGDAAADLGTPWYRPASLIHVVPGGEYGWRAGVLAWPDYAYDRLPETVKLGHAGPTGMVLYDHTQFPEEYRGALFLTDWVHRRIVAVKLKPTAAGYSATSEVFLEDEALHATDLDVGPDGALYFATGGGGTPGGLFRIRWKQAPPLPADQLAGDMGAVIRHPQFESAWSRQKLAAARVRHGASWDTLLPGIAANTANAPPYRVRAVELMQLFGPPPAEDLLVKLAADEHAAVRAKAADALALVPGPQTQKTLIDLLGDSDRTVRRTACEALARSGQAPPLDKLTKLLASEDRFEAWAARRLLERMPVDQWRDAMLATDDPRLFLQGCLALLIADPAKANATAVLERGSHFLSQFLSDRDCTDLLRLIQVAYSRGQLEPDVSPKLRDQLVDEFPSADHAINRELVRLLAYMQVATLADRYLQHLQAPEVPDAEKLHLALHLLPVREGWTTDQRLQVFEFLETAQRKAHAASFGRYVTAAAREFAKGLSPEDTRRVLADGTRWPNVTLGVLYAMPKQLRREQITMLRKLDQNLADEHDLGATRLKIGLIAVLARSADPDALAFLREIWEHDPERRQAAAMGLAQAPTEENWDYLIHSLPILEGGAAREVLVKLRTVNLAPEEPEHYRQVILRGLALQDQGAKDAVALLEYWTGERQGAEDADWKAALAAWQKWYANQWPERPAAQLPEPSAHVKWRLADILRHLHSDEGHNGSPAHGARIFERAHCAKCHRANGEGRADGLDLTNVAKRLSRKQIAESLLFPSYQIAAEHQRHIVVGQDGRIYAGRAGRDESGAVRVSTDAGREIALAPDEVDESHADRISPMPEGLLDPLTAQDIADLFAFLAAGSEAKLTQRKAEPIPR